MLTDYMVKRTYFYECYLRRITIKITLTLELHLLHARQSSKHLAVFTHLPSTKLSYAQRSVDIRGQDIAAFQKKVPRVHCETH